ncbi:MAG: hypothetical protein P8182_03655 [Deltaproteobacteria bacterium]
MVRSRFIAAIVGICLLGFTAIPGAYFPCCCKTGCKVLAERQAPSCCKPQEPVKSCCTPDRSVKPGCPYCRCLEQLQTVAIPTVNLHKNTVRLPVALAASPLPVISSWHANDAEATLLGYEDLPSEILLKTCMLVI